MAQVYRASWFRKPFWHEHWTDQRDADRLSMPMGMPFCESEEELTFAAACAQAKTAEEHGSFVRVNVGGQVYEGSPL